MGVVVPSSASCSSSKIPLTAKRYEEDAVIRSQALWGRPVTSNSRRMAALSLARVVGVIHRPWHAKVTARGGILTAPRKVQGTTLAVGQLRSSKSLANHQVARRSKVEKQ